VRRRIPIERYSLRTEQAHVDGIKRFNGFPGKRDPLTMGTAEVEALLSQLAEARQVGAPTPNQAQAAPLLLCGEVLGVEPVARRRGAGESVAAVAGGADGWRGPAAVAAAGWHASAGGLFSTAPARA
jgi:hypothetical protein